MMHSSCRSIPLYIELLVHDNDYVFASHVLNITLLDMVLLNAAVFAELALIYNYSLTLTFDIIMPTSFRVIIL